MGVTFPMEPSDTIALQAFVLALIQLLPPLPEPLQQQVQQVSQAWAAEQPGVVEQVRALVKTHSGLNELYLAEHQRLAQHYDTQERARALMGAGEADSTAITWDAIALSILQSDDCRAATESLLQQLKAQGASLHASGDALVFISALQRVISISHSRAIALLKALEKQALTIRHLVHQLDLPTEEVQALVQLLRKAGYIDRTTGGVLYNIFPMLRDQQRRDEPIDLDTYLTLTSKGHFYLHPVLIVGRHERRIW